MYKQKRLGGVRAKNEAKGSGGSHFAVYRKMGSRCPLACCIINHPVVEWRLSSLGSEGIVQGVSLVRFFFRLVRPA